LPPAGPATDMLPYAHTARTQGDRAGEHPTTRPAHRRDAGLVRQGSKRALATRGDRFENDDRGEIDCTNFGFPALRLWQLPRTALHNSETTPPQHPEREEAGLARRPIYKSPAWPLSQLRWPL